MVRLAQWVIAGSLLLGALGPAWGQGAADAPQPFAPPGTPARYPQTRH